MTFRIKKTRYRVRKKKTQAGQTALAQLNGFIEAGQAEPVYMLAHIWKDQQNAITYKELKEALYNKRMAPTTIRAWQNDYSYSRKIQKPYIP